MIEKLPLEIADLLEREASAYSEDIALKDAVRRRVEAAIVLEAPAGNSVGGKSLATAATAKGIAAPFVALIGVGAFVAGTAVGVSMHRSSPTAATPSSTSTPPISSATAIESAAPTEDKPATSSSAASVPRVVPSEQNANDDSSPQNGDLIRERELIDVAHSAMAHGRPLDAIAAAKRHEKKWPKGFLVEEREVVWIQALVATGEYDQAKVHVSAFHRNFPHSALSGAVDVSMQEINSATNVTDSGSP
jgi:hypothetical protein